VNRERLLAVPNGTDIRRNGSACQQLLDKMAARTTAVGKRLLKAFQDKGISSKKVVAEQLGYKSEASVYKVISGERELGFDALRRFVQITGRSIDWLLTDDERLIAQSVVEEALTREGSHSLSDEKGSKYPHLQKVDRPDQEPKHGIDEKVWVALLLVVEQNQKILQLLERFVESK
jgi:hypothetical protein